MQEIVLKLVCLLISICALAVAAVIVLGGMPAIQGLDALFLVSVCLVVALLFGWIPAPWLLRLPVWERLKRKRRAETADDAARRATAGGTQPQERT